MYKSLSPKSGLLYGWFFAILVFFACLQSPPCAQAQKFLENYKKPMPEIALVPAAEFEKNTTAYSETPFGDKALAFDIRIPKDWQKQRDVSLSNAAVGSKLLGELMRFYGPPKLDTRSYITVQAVNLDYKLTAEQWLLQYLLNNSYTVQGIKTYDDNMAEALFIVLEKDVTYIVRMTAHMNGKRVVFAQYFLPTQYWDDEKVIQAQSIASFKLQNKVDEFVEKMSKYQFLDVAEFFYPESWELRSEPLKSIDRMKVDLISVASEEQIKNKTVKALKGKIEIALSSVYVVDSMADELKRYRAELEKTGLMVQSLVEMHDDFKFNKDFERSPVEVYNMIDRDNTMIGYELWFAALQNGEYYYFVQLLTPSRDEDFFTWSRNTQTFRLVVSTLASQEGSLIEN